jgi:hypothetical protein
MKNIYYPLMLACLFSISCITSATSRADAPEIVVWPQQATNQLYVARETTQPFYVTTYSRSADTQSATEIELIVPQNWQVWPLNEAPPQNASATADRIVKSTLTLQSLKEPAKASDYNFSHATGYVMMVAHPLPGAVESTLELRWLRGETVLAKREVTLKLVDLEQPFSKVSDGKMRVGLWVANPKMNTETMAEVYRGLRRTGVDYIITRKSVYQQTQVTLRELGIKTFVEPWGIFRGFLPSDPPPEAYATLKDGTVDHNRWSPTYMAEGGPAFIKAVETLADELNQLDGIYGLMIDYEPGAGGLDADYGEQSKIAFEKYLGQKVLSWPADVLLKGKDEAAWINFRNDQSEAYIRWFQTILKQRAPRVHLAVSTSGATGRSDDPNRVLAATDITQLSRVTDSIHPQLYSWTSELPAQLPRFMDKLKLGQTTIAGAHAPVYPAVGTMYGDLTLSNPTYLRTQILNWWFHGASGFEIWTDVYGMDGRYLAMANELAHLFREAGERPQGSNSQNVILMAPSSDSLEILQRKSQDEKTVWIGLFNFDSKPTEVPLKTRAGWRLSDAKQTTVAIAPWTAAIVKCFSSD